ncbi:tetratricopeptide repeat protein [Vibrio litoralis]|uniref:tetratricopeptide repeat protein n=1 Tax=Vibrio litoralis TaxID=335972 RepID=UPI0018693410|nr:sel1 repeat family protein [Vibrio litoralis]
MPRYLKLSINVVLCVFTLGLMGCNNYTPNPEDDIALFQPFIDANINKKSDDPYISSTVKPGDKLYDILVNIQHGNNKEAYKYLEPLLDKKDPEAQFWYSKMVYMASVKSIPKSIRLYQEASKAGNAYAQFELSPEAEGCLAYFGEKVCTQENLTKAIEMFRQKAKQGDLRAQYFLLRMLKPDGSVIKHETYFSNNYNFTHSAETRQHYLKEVIRFAENHYYQPLMDYVDTILTFDRKKNKYVFASKQSEKLVFELLTIGANNNYLPAIKTLIGLKKESIQSNDELLQKNLKLAGTLGIALKFAWFKDELTTNDRYFFSELYKTLTGSYFYSKEEEPKTAEEKEMLDKKINDTVNTMTPMVYIDGFTSRDKWVD